MKRTKIFEKIFLEKFRQRDDNCVRRSFALLNIFPALFVIRCNP